MPTRKSGRQRSRGGSHHGASQVVTPLSEMFRGVDLTQKDKVNALLAEIRRQARAASADLRDEELRLEASDD